MDFECQNVPQFSDGILLCKRLSLPSIVDRPINPVLKGRRFNKTLEIKNPLKAPPSVYRDALFYKQSLI